MLLKPCVSQPPLVGALPADRVGEVDVDEPHARLDQPPGQQAALPVGVPAVGVAQLVGLLARGRTPRGRVSLLSIDRPARSRRRCPGPRPSSPAAAIAVDQLLQLAAVLQPADRQAGGQAQLRQLEVGRVGVFGDQQRIVHLAEEAGVLARRDRRRRGSRTDRRRTSACSVLRRAPAAIDHRAVRGEQLERVAAGGCRPAAARARSARSSSPSCGSSCCGSCCG